MKRIVALFLLLVLLFAPAVPAAAQEAESDFDLEYYGQLREQNVSINVYNWGEYIADGSDGSLDINREFEELTGIRVRYSTYATNEELYSKLRSGGASYDVIIPSDYMIARMIAEDMLLPLDFENIPNFEYVDEIFRNPVYDPGNAYSVPYTWGVVGIIYNREMIDPEVDDVESWDILWNEKFLGEILMFSNPRDAFGIAQFRLGYSPNSTDPDQLQDVFESLRDQKMLVQAYVMDEIFDKMTGGEAALAPYYAGDAYTMIDDNGDLDFALPREGTNLFVDAACIPRGAKNKLAAEMYINFLCEPEICAANGDYIGYAVPSQAAVELLDEEMRESEIVYPPGEALVNTEAYNVLPRETNLLMDELWTELLSADEQYSRLLIPILLFAGIAASIAINYFRLSRKKLQKRYF